MRRPLAGETGRCTGNTSARSVSRHDGVVGFTLRADRCTTTVKAGRVTHLAKTRAVGKVSSQTQRATVGVHLTTLPAFLDEGTRLTSRGICAGIDDQHVVEARSTGGAVVMAITGQIDRTVPPGSVGGSIDSSSEAAGTIVRLTIDTGQTGNVALHYTGSIGIWPVPVETDITSAARAHQAI